ncbi:MAG: HAMP domain-containing sensor histidine kinase [Bacteroidota bacterium]
MSLFARSIWIRLTLVMLLIALGLGSILYNQYLISQILNQERLSVELWAKAIEFNALPVHEQTSTKLLSAARMLQTYPEVPDSIVRMITSAEAAKNSQDFVTEEIIILDSARHNIPAVVVDEQGFVTAKKAIGPYEDTDALIKKYGELNEPIELVIGDREQQFKLFVYYGESPTVQLLRFYPFIQFGLLAILIGIGFTTYRSITRSEQSNLWVGMAKEAAHQLGTPISSLFGWIQLLKDEYRFDQTASNIASEIEKDIDRLRGVAERFGKIGSEPELKKMPIAPILEQVVVYMERRLPKLSRGIEVKTDLNADGEVLLNPELFQWAIENLVKNAMDAIKDKSGVCFVSVTSSMAEESILIDIEDSGSGIEPRDLKNIFRPGYSTKKRGWGLGLSLTKRIVEDYHKGDVFVLRSEAGKGTTMRVIMRLVKPELVQKTSG